MYDTIETFTDNKQSTVASGSTGEAEDTPNLREVAARIANLLKNGRPKVVEGIPQSLHPLPPFVLKREWTRLGDALKLAERPTESSIPGEKWISLRCDGTGFSKLTKRAFGKAYNDDFAIIMKACAEKLMAKFPSAKYAYTQSDEITVLLPPTNVVRGERQCHMYGGRLQKLCSLASATVSSTFTSELMALLCRQNDGAVDSTLEVMRQLTPTFDCRVGGYSTQEEAFSLILWRAYDCGVNAAQDACYKSGVPGGKAAVKLGTCEKLRWLMDKNLLPLKPHQKDGTFLVKRKRLIQGVDRKTQQPITYLRSRVEQVEGCVLQLYQDDAVFPPDEVLLQISEEARE